MGIEDAEGDFKTSRINPAWLKMRRLHEVNQLMNNSKLNPKAFNLDYSEYNYILWIRAINNLLMEIDPKLSKPESEKIYKLKSVVEDTLQKYPIMEQRNELGIPKTTWNECRWNLFKKWIEKYERLVREAADSHGLDTPTQEEDDDEL
jgi:hypothetical protein